MQMAGIKEEAELRASVQGLQGHLSRVKVEGDLAGMNFQSEAHARLFANVEDGIPELGEFPEARRDDGGTCGGIAYDIGPDGRTGKTREHGRAQFLSRPSAGHHLRDGPLPDFLRLAIRPDVFWKNGLMALVDMV